VHRSLPSQIPTLLRLIMTPAHVSREGFLSISGVCRVSWARASHRPASRQKEKGPSVAEPTSRALTRPTSPARALTGSRVQSSPRVSWTRKARAAAFRAVQNGPRPPAMGSPPRRLPSPEPQPRRARAGGAGAALADSRRSGAAPPPSATAVQECDPYRSGFVPRNPAAQFGRAPPPSIGLRRQHGGGSALGDRGRREMRGCSGFCGECGMAFFSSVVIIARLVV